MARSTVATKFPLWMWSQQCQSSSSLAAVSPHPNVSSYLITGVPISDAFRSTVPLLIALWVLMLTWGRLWILTSASTCHRNTPLLVLFVAAAVQRRTALLEGSGLMVTARAAALHFGVEKRILRLASTPQFRQVLSHEASPRFSYKSPTS